MVRRPNLLITLQPSLGSSVESSCRFHAKIAIHRSGSIFATVGFVVRLRQYGHKDTGCDEFGILLWAAAELAIGNLCVCFPEVAFIFRRRSRRGFKPRQHPSASQLQRG